MFPRLATILVAAFAAGCTSGLDQPMLGHELEFLVDSDRNLTADEALAADGWRVQDREVPNFGFRSDVFWFRLVVDSESAAPEQRLLEILYPMLDNVDLKVIHDGNLVQDTSVGDARPFDDRPIAHRNLVIPITINPGSTTILMRVETEGVMQMPVKIWEPNDLIRFDESRSGVEGAYFGIMIVMLLYNLFLYINLRERRYLYYVLHVATSTLFLATLHGLSFRYLWPEAVWWQSRAVPTLVALSVVFISLFVTSFLTISPFSRTGKFFKWLAITAGVTTVFSLFLPYALVLRVAGSLSVIALTASLIVSFRGWKSGQSSARYLIMAWGAFVVGSIALALNKFGILPRVALTEQGMLIGSVLDVVLLSIALADRIRLERLLREQAQEQALNAEHQARERLEQAVQERTRELKSTMGQLEEVNEELQRLSNLDGLTGVYNRRFFEDRLREAWLWSERDDQELSVIMLDVDHFKRINDENGHLVGDECLKLVANCIEKELKGMAHVLARYGGEEFVVILPDCSTDRAAEIADRVRTAVSELEYESDPPVSLRISAGVAGRKSTAESATQLVDWADQALYQAKDGGRNQTRRFSG